MASAKISSVIGDQPSCTRQKSESEVCSAGACAFFEPLHGLGRSLVLATARRGFDEFGQAPAVHTEIVVFTSFAGGCKCFFVPAEPVVQDGGGPSGHAQRPAFTPGGCARCGGLDDKAAGSLGVSWQTRKCTTW